MLTDRATAAGRATELLRDMVAIESVNPFFADGERGEVAMADYLADRFASLGFEPQRQPVVDGRQNVFARLDVPNARATILFEAHMDTVTLEPIGRSMLDPRIGDGRMNGRGSCDTKASLAAMLTALEALRDRTPDLRCNVIVLGSVDEEYLMRGIVEFARNGPKVDAAIVGEPTGNNVIRAHKGLVRWRVATRGRAAHTSRPESGDNAIYQMAATIAGLRNAIDPGLRSKTHPLLSPPTFTVSMIEGGLGANIVPDRCEITIDRRTLPLEKHSQVIADLHAAAAELMRNDPSLRIEIAEPFASIGGLDTPEDDPLVALTTRIAARHGGAAVARGVPYGTNAPGLAERGVPTIVLGPGDIAQAHTDSEWVDLNEVERAAEMYAQIALAFPGSA